jgi:uncharacterized membrane protein YdjX (TVP38/TMEM64 family)
VLEHGLAGAVPAHRSRLRAPEDGGGRAIKKPAVSWKWVAGLVGLAAVLGGLPFVLPLQDWSELLEDRIENMALLEGLMLFCAVAIVASLLFVPAWIFPLVAGAVFGFGWGIVAAAVSAVTAAVVAFLLARHVLHSLVEKLACRNPTFKAVDQAVAKEPLKVVALLRLSPVLPSGMKSYFLGLTCVPLPSYTYATAVGMTPGLLLKVYLGAMGRSALGKGGPLKWALLAAGIVATVTLTVIIGRKVRKKLNL